MTYTPHTEADIQAMLATIGVDSLDALFQDVPEDVRYPEVDLPEAHSQMEASWVMEDLANANYAAGKTNSFIGAGAYNHYSPPVVNYIIQRGEFMTAYTPYQPEVSQGTLQAVFEYQSMICALTGMDAANASHYDGATSLAEAVLMAYNIGRGKRSKVLMSPGVHPHYREVVRTYMIGFDVEIVGDEGSQVDLDALIASIDDNTALVAVQYPNFFGQIEEVARVMAAAQEKGALGCIVADPVSLGLLKPPGALGADVVVGEGQGLGIPLSYGGPYLGFFATRDKYVRKMAGRLVGETNDVNGKPGYVLTLATREQHIRREKATSNICTNQGLMALASAVYMAAMGKQGLREVAELCYHKSHYAAGLINELPGFSVEMDKPFLKEIVVHCPAPVEEINSHLLGEHGIIGGFDLSSVYSDRTNQMLLAIVETNTKNDIDELVTALSEVAQ
ncbi:MAG: aminomethyl-transferring glycine dehydrogenase subunit GcvPA [Chloroflexi bacterium]|nr:aminomethyl-transferring glycine dehydrogenase subunit GcvPA [Chloroflexota bacterium]